MVRIQIKEFDWGVWDYSMFGKFVYTYAASPTPISFYLKDPITLHWGQGVADIVLDGVIVHKFNVKPEDNDKEHSYTIMPDQNKKYSTLEIIVKSGPVVIDGMEWMEQFITQQNLTADFSDAKVLAGSFKINLKQK